MTDAMRGHCLCGAVEITIEAPAHEIEICRCSMCRRWSGAIYTAQTGKSVMIAGEDKASVYRSSEWAERAFCGMCGSHLWFRFLPTGNRSFSAGLFDAAASHTIEKEIFVDEAADWCRIEGDHPRQTGAEVIAEAEAAGYKFD